MAMDTQALLFSLIGFPAFMAGLFVFVTWVISNLGWSRLAGRFESSAELPADAELINGQTISLNWFTNYKGIMRAAITRDALWLRPGFLFQLFHPQLRIPFNEIERTDGSPSLFTALRLTLRGDMPSIRLYGRLGKAMQERLATPGLAPRPR